jgi:hypothetical protein
MWIIDFGLMAEHEAAQYRAPFEYVRATVLPQRMEGRDEKGRETWWQHLRPRPELRTALVGLRRYTCTPRVAKHRVFLWLDTHVVPDSATIAFAADDDYTFGVLHSQVHESWSLAQGTSLEDRPRYTPTTCFETFPFPETTSEQREDVSRAARHLDEVRSHLLASDDRLTLTRLYNEVAALREARDAAARVFPLLLAHEALDVAVAAAYGWEWPLEDEEVLSRLLALNLDRAEQEGAGSGHPRRFSHGAGQAEAVDGVAAPDGSGLQD